MHSSADTVPIVLWSPEWSEETALTLSCPSSLITKFAVCVSIACHRPLACKKERGACGHELGIILDPGLDMVVGP